LAPILSTSVVSCVAYAYLLGRYNTLDVMMNVDDRFKHDGLAEKL